MPTYKCRHCDRQLTNTPETANLVVTCKCGNSCTMPPYKPKPRAQAQSRAKAPPVAAYSLLGFVVVLLAVVIGNTATHYLFKAEAEREMQEAVKQLDAAIGNIGL